MSWSNIVKKKKKKRKPDNNFRCLPGGVDLMTSTDTAFQAAPSQHHHFVSDSAHPLYKSLRAPSPGAMSDPVFHSQERAMTWTI